MAWSSLLQRASYLMFESIPAPEQLTERIARRAVQIAQVIGPRRTSASLNSLFPVSDNGIIGLEVPPETAYIFDLENGVKAHAMMDLAGRVIPIRKTDGTIAFRTASADKIGTIPIINRNFKDGKIQTVKREWYYPEKPGLHFLQKSLKMSVDEWKRTANTNDIVNMLMQTEYKDDISQIVYGRPAT